MQHTGKVHFLPYGSSTSRLTLSIRDGSSGLVSVGYGLVLLWWMLGLRLLGVLILLLLLLRLILALLGMLLLLLDRRWWVSL